MSVHQHSLQSMRQATLFLAVRMYWTDSPQILERLDCFSIDSQ